MSREKQERDIVENVQEQETESTTESRLRTNQQNHALHLYFEMAAEALNSSGYDIQKTIKHQMSVPWGKESFKELVWRQAQKTYLGKASTTELTTKEVDEVYEIVNRYLALFGIHVPFPTKQKDESGH